ncbi:MAG: exodeoxyribonuclease VII small subunit [Gemmatimonadales bacterium]
MSNAKPTFGDEIERLESIVRSLEDRDVDLDKALELFRQGVESLKAARRLLEDSELTVQRILEEADGTLGTSDIDI